MQTLSFYYRTLPACAVLLAMIASLKADDLRLRIKIPNPIPRIVKNIERVGMKVGNIVIRTAERIDGGDEPADPRRDVPPPHLVPALPLVGVTVHTEATLTPADPRYPDRYRDPRVPYDNPLGVAPANPPHRPPSQSPQIVLTPLPPGRAPLKTGEPIHRPAPTPVAGNPSAAAITHPADGPSAAGVNAAKPAPPPKHEYGRNVPGRPGLIYPPGMKEIPENMIDVRGIAPGTKVRDPATKMVFRVP